MYSSVVKVKKIAGLSFSKLSFKVASVYILTQSSDMFTKSSDMSKNTVGVKKCKANKKPTYVRPKSMISAEAKKSPKMFQTI